METLDWVREEADARCGQIVGVVLAPTAMPIDKVMNREGKDQRGIRHSLLLSNSRMTVGHDV
jgi:hypothetical protein